MDGRREGERDEGQLENIENRNQPQIVTEYTSASYRGHSGKGYSFPIVYTLDE